jgi:hypothetical protein
MLLRSSNRRPLDLSHCFYLDLENEVLQDGIAKLPVCILVVTMNQSKTNQHGNMEYGATMRHRDPLCYLISRLAFWLFYRRQIEDEPFPSFKSSDDWYDLKILRQSKDRPTALLSYTTANSWTTRLYNKAGTTGSKTTHLPRVAAAINADMQGVPEGDVSAFVHPTLFVYTLHQP